jgi:hypothetical protein
VDTPSDRARTPGQSAWPTLAGIYDRYDCFLDHAPLIPNKAGHLSVEKLRQLLQDAVGTLDVVNARKEVAPFVRDRRTLDVWSTEFFVDVVQRVVQI